ncbi:MAG: HD domain-containing phosphohydrolase [Bacillota bacterium]|jgi:HD-GYP domain-containing protein (c-di-GMP phosphodiesterase class II)|nr:HD domain-containing phosphohydrolase [Bacillota bacterium]NLP23736.1 HD domain-containing protein [Syntrophomonadaceae bacterium]
MKKSIPLISLSIGEPLAQDIFDEQNRLLLRAGTHLSDQYIKSLQSKGIETVFIAITPQIENPSTDEEKPPEKKPPKKKLSSVDLRKPYYDLLYEQTRVKARGYYVKIIHQDFNLKAREFTDLLLNDPEASLNFYLQTKRSQTEYNYEEYHVNTGILAALISNWLNLNRHIIYEIVNVAMLHDIGETRISPDILQKPGRLDKNEMEIVRTHPNIGFEILSKTDWLSSRELLGVLTHHERLNGQGYPHKLLGSQIIIHSRVTAVASIYNTATTDRPYAKAKHPAKVLSELRDRSFGELDSKVTRVLYERISDLISPKN